MNGYIQSLFMPEAADTVRPPPQSRFAAPAPLQELVAKSAAEPEDIRKNSVGNRDVAAPESSTEKPLPVDDDRTLQILPLLSEPASPEQAATNPSQHREAATPQDTRQIKIASSLAASVQTVQQLDREDTPSSAVEPVQPVIVQTEPPPAAVQTPAEIKTQERGTDVTVSIGRVIVTGSPSEPAAAPQRGRPRGVMSLDEYLGRRTEDSL